MSNNLFNGINIIEHRFLSKQENRILPTKLENQQGNILFRMLEGSPKVRLEEMNYVYLFNPSKADLDMSFGPNRTIESRFSTMVANPEILSVLKTIWGK